jgi:trehalose 6-phosphate phosphatase
MDGTLIEIAETPSAADTDPCLLNLIRHLHAACQGAVAVVSGRAVADLDHRLAGLNLPLAGQHGLERRDSAGRHYQHATTPRAKDAIEAHLRPVLQRHPGLLLEDKGLSLALHYRRTPQLASYVHRLLHSLVEGVKDSLQLQKGKRVVEIKPAGYDKGTAVEDFLAEPPFRGRRPVYIGDDTTDEHGFAVVNRHDGISIKVGKGRSQARYRLPDVAAVRGWLGTVPTAIGEGL